ncbi:MAG TPA: protein phosphatase 2C domain-containing protein, partial [Nocardioidaceae bacterium]
DGMGGAPAGDHASSLAVSTMRRLDSAPPDDLPEALAGAVHRANDRLSEAIEEDRAVEGMGTTIDAVLFDGARIGVAHLGDSRGYLWRDGELLRLTSDHTWVQSLIDEGRITEEEAKVHAHRSLLLKVLDGRHDNDPDLTLYDVQAGDRILLCSDGLSSFVPHDRLERVLSIGTADSVAHELVTLALEAMSNDNITVVIADVVDDGPDDAAEPIVVGAAAEPHRTGRSRLRAWAHREEPEEAMLLPDDIDPEEIRYAPREPRRYRWLFRAIVAIVALAVVVGLGMVAYGWSQDQYYVAAADGKVAIYQGVQADLPGVDLHHVYETQDLTLDELPSYRRSQVIEGLGADDLDDARQIVGRLESFAQTCAQEATSTSEQTTTTETTRATNTTRPGSSPRTTPAHRPNTGKTPGGGAVTTKPTRAAGGGPGAGHATRTTRHTEPATTGSTRTGGSGAHSQPPEECAGATPSAGSAAVTTGTTR